MDGSIGNNTYLFGRGDGVDTIGDYNDGSAGKRNVLRFKAGVSASDVTVSRQDTYLVLSINGTSDKVSATSFFYQNTPTNTWNPIQEVVFEDGTTWSMTDLVAKTQGASAQGGSGSSSQSRARVLEGFDTQAAIQTATLNNQAQQLADAMAGFAPSVGGQTSGSAGAYAQGAIPVLVPNALG
ncbi:hypothetical protein HNP48_006896 [Acidovorax soli]|uniref:Haemolysin-type calcium binding-related domain-containing protein n=2 Tax=Acidovorax soli TaxID=592050 RepID=A0A7X0PM46_9BURK|nr:hypothetical protein [Acidovorax soli]